MNARSNAPFTGLGTVEARRLYDIGYRQISKKYRTVSRVILSDDDLAKFFDRQGLDNMVRCCRVEELRDHYRRVYSRDKLDLPHGVFEAFRKITRGLS